MHGAAKGTVYLLRQLATYQPSCGTRGRACQGLARPLQRAGTAGNGQLLCWRGPPPPLHRRLLAGTSRSQTVTAPVEQRLLTEYRWLSKIPSLTSGARHDCGWMQRLFRSVDHSRAGALPRLRWH